MRCTLSHRRCRRKNPRRDVRTCVCVCACRCVYVCVRAGGRVRVRVRVVHQIPPRAQCPSACRVCNTRCTAPFSVPSPFPFFSPSALRATMATAVRGGSLFGFERELSLLLHPFSFLLPPSLSAPLPSPRVSLAPFSSFAPLPSPSLAFTAAARTRPVSRYTNV